MEKLLFINDTLCNKISYYHIVLFLIFLPFDRFYTELILISFLMHTLFHLKREHFQNFPIKIVLVIQSVFFLGVIGVAYSQNTNQAISITTRQLAIFLFPLLLSLNQINLNQYKNHFFSAFAFICVSTVVYLYFDAFQTIRFYHLPFTSLFSSAFINHNFSLPIGLHATYLSLYIAISLVYLVTSFFGSSLKARLLLISAILVLIAGLVQLGSRSVLIAVVLLLSIVFPAFHLKNKQRLAFVSIVSLVFIIAGIGISGSNSFKERFIGELKFDFSENPSPYIIENPRMQRWELAWQLILKYPIQGYGSGDEVDLLKEKYFTNKLYNSYLFGLNAHNEYLSFLITGGVIGLLIYLFTLFYGFRLAFKSRDILFLAFLFLISIVSLSENFLVVNKGIFFYAFFISLFLCSGIKRNSFSSGD